MILIEKTFTLFSKQMVKRGAVLLNDTANIEETRRNEHKDVAFLEERHLGNGICVYHPKVK